MRRLTVFSLCAALCGVAQAVASGDKPAQPPQQSSGNGLAGTIESVVGRIFEGTSPAVVRVESEDELGKVSGTGFFIDADGTIFTLSSVVGDGNGLVVTHGDSKLPARLLVKDPRTGIALIKTESDQPKPFLIKGDCAKVKTATPLVVVGYPFDREAAPSFGIVGGFDRNVQDRFLATTHIRANIPVQRGQGGSPVLNLDGEVVGILVSGMDDGAGCFVLPIRAAEKIRSDFARFGDVRHGWAGVTVQEMPAAVQGSRMMIDVVDPGGPAANQFRSGDVVLQVGDIAIREPEDALDAAFFLTAGEPVEVRVARGEEIITVPLTPSESPFERKDDMQALAPGSLIAR